MVLPACLAVAALLPLLQLPQHDLPPAPAGSKVLATVDGAPIRASEVERYLWDWYGTSAVEDLILFTQVRHYADKQGVRADEAEVQKAYDEQIARFKTTLRQGETVESAMRAAGVPPSRLYLRVSTDMLLGKLAEKEFRPADFVQVSTILIKPRTQSAADVAEAIQKAQGAYDRLHRGENWTAVLNSTTDDATLQRNAGLIGWRLKAAFPEATQKELASLKAGDVTKPVQTQNGIQIFRVDASGKEVSGAELEALRQQFTAAAKPRVLQSIRDQSKVVR